MSINTDDNLQVTTELQVSRNTVNNLGCDKFSSNSTSSMDDNNEDSSDSSESNRREDEKETEYLKQYNQLLEHLKVKPFDYNAYVQLCEITDELGDLDRLQHAYELFAGAYPLTSELWLKYLNIRIELAQYNSERESVCKIFSTALRDYYSITIAHKLAEFLSNVEGGTDQSLWSELVSVYGLNYFSGHHIFRLKRDSIANNDKLSNLEKIRKTIEVYRWELRNPLETIEEAWKRCREYVDKENDEILVSAPLFDINDLYEDYKVATAMSSTLSLYETRLAEANIESNDVEKKSRAYVYFEYLTFLERECGRRENQLSTLHQLRQTIYERLVADYCLLPEYWLAYIEYIESRETVELPEIMFYRQTPLEINIRALRNCSAQTLYIKAIQQMEKAACTEDKVRELLEQALSVGYENPEPEVAIYLEYLTYLTRRTDYKSEDQASELRKNFDWAWNYLGRRWGVLADTNCEILQLWGTIEYELLNNPSAARELWTTVMGSSDNSSNSALWVLFANLEAHHSLTEARNIFCRALEQTKLDNVNVIETSWKLLERTHGTEVSRGACYSTILILEKKRLEKQKKPINEVSLPKQGRKELKRKAQQIENADVDIDVAPKTKNMKFLVKNASELKDTPEKKTLAIEKAEIDVTKDNIRVFLSNIDYHLNEQDVRNELSPHFNIVNIELKRSKNGKSRGFGFMELGSPNEVQIALRFDRHLINGRPIYISLVQREASQRKKFDYAEGKEVNKLFVKGLPSDCTQHELEQLFGVYGKLLDVRLVYHKSGNFKQIAFVEFEHEADASKAALANNEMELRGSKLSVAISNPPPRTTVDHHLNTSLAETYIRHVAKPRLAFIPTVVRQKLNTAKSSADSNIQEREVKTKSNADFRKLFQK